MAKQNQFFLKKSNRNRLVIEIIFEKNNLNDNKNLEDLLYDPACLEIDRILSTTEIFPVVHPNKVLNFKTLKVLNQARKIKGKWSELLVTVMSKLLNFEKNHIMYGVYFIKQSEN